MTEPARKFNDIEPDIKPNFGVINGGGNTTPDRATLRSIEKQESNPEQINNDDDISKKESEGSNVIQGPWKNNVNSVNNPKISSKKKKGPLVAILITLIGGGIGVGGLLSPSLLIVNLKEVLVNKFDTQLASMDLRTTKILSSKMGTTKSVCGSVISVACKYSTLSEKQMANFEKAGIKVNYDKTGITGRPKPTSFEFEGKTIKASEFSSELASSTEFRSAIKKAYNPKFAGFKP